MENNNDTPVAKAQSSDRSVRNRLRIPLLVFVALAAGFALGALAATSLWMEPPILIRDADLLPALKGHRVIVEGVATQTQLAASVVLDDRPVYILDEEEWPAEIAGRVIRVQGALRQRLPATAPSPPESPQEYFFLHPAAIQK